MGYISKETKLETNLKQNLKQAETNLKQFKK